MSTEEARTSKKEMTSQAKYVNIAIQLILLVVVVYIITRTVNHVGVVLFTWHPVFVSIGYLLLMSHAILTMADNNFVTQSLGYQNRVTVHWILQTSALILITIAQTCIFLHKEDLNKPHYTSTHSLFGVTTYMLTLIGSLGGIFTKFSLRFKEVVKPVIVKIGHSFIGLLTYILAVTTICLGVNQTWVNSYDSYTKPIVYVVLTFTTLYVTIKSFILFSQRIANVAQRSNL